MEPITRGLVIDHMAGHFSVDCRRTRTPELSRFGLAFSIACVAFVVLSITCASAQSQATATPLPSFEVASIKLNHSGSPIQFFEFSDPSRFRTTNIPAKELIEFAYNVQPFQVSGGPTWINSPGYDIEAKVDDSLVAQLQKLPIEQREDQLRLMLRSLLTDRLRLKLSHGTKELPIYALVVAKSGAKLTSAVVPAAQPPGAKASSEPQGPSIGMSFGKIEAKEMPVSALAEVLARQPELGGRLVIDQTGIKGNYDFALRFTPDRARSTNGANVGSPPDGPLPPDADGPSIFTAIQEQLGLKLESQKGPVDVIVIDHIEKPSEN